jgi:hypothetical protein
MAFDIIERSEYQGLPQECYLFEYLDDQYAYTSSKQIVPLNAIDFAPLQISRGKLTNEADMFKTTLTVTVPVDCDVALLFRTWIEQSVLITVYRQHFQDSDFIVMWSGKVGSCKFKGNQAELSCTPLYTTMKKLGIKRVYQRSCPHTQYTTSCGLDINLWKQTSEITSVDDSLITFVDFYPTDYFAGGSITVGDEKRWIMSSATNQVVLMSPLVKVVPTMDAILLPGCQHSHEKCRDVFVNYLNNGAFPFIPGKNPFRASLLG